MADRTYGELVKADVDITRGLLLVDMELHADGEAFLLEDGSQQSDIWGINLYPGEFGTESFIEFDSMINIRPSQANRSRGVENPEIRQQIIRIVSDRVHE